MRDTTNPFLSMLLVLVAACEGSTAGGDVVANPDAGGGSDGGPVRGSPGDGGLSVVCGRDDIALGPNSDPVVFWPRPTRAYPGLPFEFSLIAYDPNNDPLTFTLDAAPDGMTIDDVGVMHFEPVAGSGPYSVTARVDDGRGGIVDRSFTLEVTTRGFLFVDPVGDDSASGSLDSPFATIERGLAGIKAAGGGTLLVRGGTYNTAWNWERDGIKAPMGSADFSEEDPADIRGYPGEAVIIAAAGGHGLWAFSNSYVIFSHMEVRGSTAGERGGAIAHGDHIVFHDITVRDSNFSASNNCTGFNISGEETIVHRSAAYDNYDRGDGGVRTNNSNYLFYGDRAAGGHSYILHSVSGGSTGAGYKIKHAGPAQLTVHGSIDVGSGAGFNGADDGTTIAYSTFVDNGTGIGLGITDPNEHTRGAMRVVNNTIVRFNRSGLDFQTGYLGDGDVEFSRNILVSEADVTGTDDGSANVYRILAYDGAPALGGYSFDHNCISVSEDNNGFRTGRLYANLEGWRAEGRDASSILADPRFAGPDDFHLLPDSECLDLGVEVGAFSCP